MKQIFFALYPLQFCTFVRDKQVFSFYKNLSIKRNGNVGSCHMLRFHMCTFRSMKLILVKHMWGYST